MNKKIDRDSYINVFLNKDISIIDSRQHKCDVCYTCKWFDAGLSKCVAAVVVLRKPDYEVEQIINDPGKYSCAFWIERKL